MPLIAGRRRGMLLLTDDDFTMGAGVLEEPRCKRRFAVSSGYGDFDDGSSVRMSSNSTYGAMGEANLAALIAGLRR